MHRFTIPLGFLALVAAFSACGDSDILGPAADDSGTDGTFETAPGFVEDGLGVVPGDAETCPEDPSDLVYGAYGERLHTLTVHDPERQIDVPIDVMLPIDPTGLPLVFGGGPFGVVVYSHGGLPYDPTEYTIEFEPMFPEFTRHWVARGYIVLAPRHRHFPDDPEKNQEWRTRDVGLALDHVRDMVREIDPYTFVDLRNPVIAGFSAGATTAAIILGTTHLSGGLQGLDFRDPRFRAGIFLAGYFTYLIRSDVRADHSRLDMPILAIVGSDDVGNEPPNTPEDFLGIARDSPPGGKHGVLVNGAGHYLGARPWRGDAPGTLEASQQATTLFLRSYTRPPSPEAVATLSDGNFCGLVPSRLVDVERHEPEPAIELDREIDPKVPRRGGRGSTAGRRP